MKKIIFLLLIATLILFLFGCTQVNEREDADKLVFSPLNDSWVNSDAVNLLISANNRFSMDFYEQVDSKENVFFSPFSIFSSMSMVYEGARLKTAKEFEEVLYYPRRDDFRRPAFANTFNNLMMTKDYNLVITNMLWPADDFFIREGYIDVINDYYFGGVRRINYNDTEKAAKTINDFIALNTNDKIKDLLSANDLIDARLVLTNTIYFFANWVHKFDGNNTKESDFFIDDTTVKAELMNQTERFLYAENDEFQLVVLPYVGDNISMKIYLPKNTTASEFEFLNNDELYLLNKDLRYERIDLTIPKFKMETKYQLSDNFKEMGLIEAFTENADFSGISNEDLFISEIIHQAFIEVNEESTEAAAATAIVMETTSMPIEEDLIEFNANHPFIFKIVENSNNTILFMGKLVDPSSE